LIAAILYLALAGPFLLTASMKSTSADEHADADEISWEESHETGSFHHFANGWLMYRLDRPFGNHLRYGLPLFLGATVVAVRGTHRRRAAALLGVLAAVALVLYVPPVCALLLKLMRQEWILGRYSFLLHLGFTAIVAGCLGAVVETRVAATPLRLLLVTTIGLLALPYGAREGSLSWRGYARKLASGAARRELILDGADAVRTFVNGKIEPGSVVLTSPRQGVPLVMLWDCYIIAAYSSNNGVPDLDQRREDIDILRNGTAPIDRRASLLLKYDVRYYLSTRGESPRWPGDWIRQHWYEEPWLIVEFDREAVGG
jgi:hypothetical protein